MRGKNSVIEKNIPIKKGQKLDKVLTLLILLLLFLQHYIITTAGILLSSQVSSYTYRQFEM